MNKYLDSILDGPLKTEWGPEYWKYYTGKMQLKVL